MMKCPKCRMFPSEYIEHINCITTHSVGEDGFPEEIGYNIEGDYYKVEAICSCGHSWTVKNAIQITDLMKK